MTVIPSEVAQGARLRPPQPAEAAEGLFTAPDGVELYYEDSGGDAPVLFYIYGLGCSIRHWKYPMAYFGAGGPATTTHRQIWIDFRGHGRSQPPRSGQRLTIASIVDDIVALCRHRQIERATFLGQSMGGDIALQLARDYPELVRGLVLLTTPGRDPGRNLPFQPVSRLLWQGMIKLNRYAPLALRLAYAGVKSYSDAAVLQVPLREFVRWNGFNPQLSKTEDIDEYLGEIFEISPTLFYDMAEDLADFDVAKFPKQVACPTLAIAGGRDQVVPLSEMRRLVKFLPAGELFVVKHGSHCPHFDDPGLVNRRIDRFLALHGI